VTALGLSGNRIMDQGVRAIGAMLKANRAMQSLYLRNNAIGVDGARHLADALRVNKTLTTLNLKNNKLHAEGARVLCEVRSAAPPTAFGRSYGRCPNSTACASAERMAWPAAVCALGIGTPWRSDLSRMLCAIQRAGLVGQPCALRFERVEQ